MSSKLEAMVGLLAGRKTDATLLGELDDPSSEASRFLEATRDRSRALFDGSTDRPAPIATNRRKRISRAILAVVAVVAVAAFFWMIDRRTRALEASLARCEAEARADAQRLEPLFNRPLEPRPAKPDAIEIVLKRLEQSLQRLETRPAAEPSTPDPRVAPLLEELAQHRRELAAHQKAETRRLEEIEAATHDAARLLRLLLNRLQPAGSSPEPSPGLNPPRPSVSTDNRRVSP